MTKIITTSIVLDLLEAAVAERGADFVYHDEFGSDADYNGCQYIVSGQAACIVGVVLNKLGVPDEALERLDYGEYGTSGWIIDSNHAVDILGENGIRFEDHESLAVLRAAQSRQDSGQSWGEALEYAETVAGKIES